MRDVASVTDLHEGAGDLGEVLRLRSAAHPDRRAYAFLQDGLNESDALTYGQLDARAREIAADLQQRFEPGDRLVMLYPPGLEFNAAFFACLYAGMVAVPAYPPRPGKSDKRIPTLVRDCLPAGFLTVSAGTSDLEPLRKSLGMSSRRVVATDAVPAGGAAEYAPPAVDPGSIAFLQYTSGSTATPKGVMVTHANMMANERAIAAVMEHDASLVGLAWLPVFHDMGLLGNMLQPIFVGGSSMLVPPLTFLKRPLCWPRAISKYRVTSSGGPNFAFDLCARAAATQGLPPDLDLANWTVAYVGAEPVRPDSLHRFSAAFKAAGFRTEAFFPCYGMAEATLIVTGGPKAAAPVTPRFSARALLAGRGEARRLPGPGSRRITGCGRVVPGHEILVVDPETRIPCDEGAVGEIWVRGPSIAQGYFRKREATVEIFNAMTSEGRGPFLRTGDLGFVRDGQYFITGRLKDMLIIRGENHYPHDIEITVEKAHAGIRPGGCAAFAVEIEGREQLVVAAEISRTLYHRLRSEGGRPQGLPVVELGHTVREQVAGAHEIPVHQLVLLKPGAIPRTSSGKIRRGSCRSLHEGRKLEPLAVL